MSGNRFVNTRLLFGALVLGLLTLLACNSGSKSLSNAPQAGGNSGSLVGAGSTIVYPVMTRWISDFQSSHSGIQINYQSIGIGGGIQQLKNNPVDFGASDAPLDDRQLKEMPAPALVQIPESAGPVCITYNLPELKAQLKPSGTTLVGIYLGKIKSWQDPAVKKENPGVSLPAHDIVVANRSDGSGTTNIFTTYLAKISPEWQNQVGKGVSVSWPTGLGGKGSEGLTGVVKQTPGGIGYVELTYATDNKLPVVSVKNQAGNWVQPSTAGTTAAINAFAAELAKDVRTPIVDPPASAKDAYPISGLTFLLVPKHGKHPKKTGTLKQFIAYVVTQGQAQSLAYAPISASLQQQDENLLPQVGGTAQPAQAKLSGASAAP